MAGTVSTFTSNDNENKSIVDLENESGILVEAEFSPRISLYQWAFPFPEFGHVSYALIVVTVPTIEVSFRTLLFCLAFHWQGDSLLAG
jgi:hypothetical protein